MGLFGDNLKEIREEKGFTQSDLANLVEVHVVQLSKYERNLASPSVDVVKRIAEALNITTDQLIYGDAKQKAKDKIQDHELLNLFTRVQSLKKDDVHCIKSLINAYVLKTDLQKQLA
jgi:transcriptional regulator with XRE-family HTH domain